MVKVMAKVMGLLRGSWSEAWSFCLPMVNVMLRVIGLVRSSWSEAWSPGHIEHNMVSLHVLYLFNVSAFSHLDSLLRTRISDVFVN